MFSLQKARELASWSNQAYGLWPASTVLQEVTHIDNDATDIHAIIVEQKDRLVLAFRGTYSLANFFTDASITMTEWGATGMKVHRGFLEAYLSIDGKVMEALDAAPAMPLWITGHSLGAALAELCAFSLIWYHEGRWLDPDMGTPIAGVYPIACPRWTNRAGANRYDTALGDQTWRLNEKLDPIPCLPWAAPGWRSEMYVHTSNHARVTGEGVLEINRPWYKTISNKVVCAIREEFRGEFVPMADHQIARYIAALNAVHENKER